MLRFIGVTALLLFLCVQPLRAQSTTYGETWERMHRTVRSPDRKQVHVDTAAAPHPGSAAISEGTAQTPAFAGFFAAQTLAGTTPLNENGLILTADFNNDGHPDIASLDSAAGTIALSLNDGAGHFSAPTSTALPAPGISLAAASDLNGDGFADIVIVNSALAVSVLINKQNGTFLPTVTLALPNAVVPSLPESGVPATYSVSLALGATSSSGFRDIVAEYVNSSFLPTVPVTLYRTVFLNDGAANFSATQTKQTSGTLAEVETLLNGQLLLVDVNHDGKADLITGATDALETNALVDVSLGNGDGTFQAAAAAPALSVPLASVPAVGYLPTLAVGSLTGNATKQDIVIGSGGSVYTALAHGDGTYAAPTVALSRGAAGSSNVQYVGLGDLNGDGHTDLVVSGAGALTSYLGKGDGTFGPASGAVAVNQASYGFPALALADFNGDGKPDFASFTYTGADVELGLGRGDGTFVATPLLYDASASLAPLLFSPSAAADYNGDGISDLLGTNLNDGTILLALGGEGGQFTYKTVIPASSTTYLYPQRVVADFNRDGKPDAVYTEASTTSSSTIAVAVALSHGDGTFAAPVRIPLAVSLQGFLLEDSFAVGDVNGDGKADLVFSYAGDAFYGLGRQVPSGYFVALGNGDGTFGQANFTALGNAARQLLLAPYHGPSASLDMLITDVGGLPTVSLLEGNGDGTFASGNPVVLSSGVFISSILASDFNKDGHADLTLLSPFNEVIENYDTPEPAAYLYAGNGDGTFAPAMMLDNQGDGGDGLYADVNGDGNPDLIYAGANALLEINGTQRITDAGLTLMLSNGDGTFAAPQRYPLSLGGSVLAGNFTGDSSVSLVADIAGGAAFFINQGATRVALSASSSAPLPATPFTLTAQVGAVVAGRPVPSGSVAFFDAQTPLGSGTLTGGAASLPVPGLAAGTHTIVAHYSGDANFAPNNAATLVVNVTTPAPDFSLTAASASLTVARGQSATVALTLTANAALSGTVTFACGGLPSETTCSFSPASLPLTPGQSATSTLTIATTAASTTTADAWPARVGAACALCLLLLPWSRRTRGALLALLLFTGASLGLSACGASANSTSPSPPTNPGTPAGTYALTITATAGMVTHTVPVVLVVQ